MGIGHAPSLGGWLLGSCRHPRFGPRQQRLAAGEVAGAQPLPGERYGQHRSGVQRRFGKPRRPPVPGGHLEVPVHRPPGALEQADRTIVVPRRTCLVDRLAYGPVGFEPGARAAVPFAHRVAQAPSRLGAEHVGEQGVEAVPAPLVVEADEEQVGAFEALEHLGAVVATRHGVARRRAESIEHRYVEKERPNPFVDAAQHFVRQVVEHVTIAAGEGLHEGVRIVPSAERQGCELQPRRPAFGGRSERVRILGGQLQPHRTAQEAGALLRLEAQIVGVDLGQLAAGSKAGEGQVRLVARRDDEVEARGRMVDQPHDHLADRGAVGLVVVVEHQRDLLATGGEGVDELGRDRVGGFGACRVERAHDALTEVGLDASERGHEVGQETVRLAVVLVQRQPGGRHAGRFAPLGGQGRLAEPGRCGEHRVAAAKAELEALDESKAPDRVGTDGGREPLRGQQGRGHRRKRTVGFRGKCRRCARRRRPCDRSARGLG